MALPTEPLIGSKTTGRGQVGLLRLSVDVLLVLVAIGCAVGLALRIHDERAAPARTCGVKGVCIASECMHALGGGRLSGGGDFPHLDPTGCKAQLSAYITSGAYLKEVNASIAAAFDALALPRPTPGTTTHATAAAGRRAAAGAAADDRSKQVVVFDIDETALSNIVEFEAPARRGGAPRDWDAAVLAAAAGLGASPALAPTLEFYNALCAAGYAVAFVTGRSEPVRAATRANLAAAGYGDRCPDSKGTAARSAAASDAPCCYVDLILRPPGDDRLASIYKPWARSRLEARGYQLLASIGDQFSDINGEHPARYAFKLPNPFYFIL